MELVIARLEISKVRQHNPLGSIEGFVVEVRGEKQPDKCISRHEREQRDIMMDAIQRKIFLQKIPDSEIIVSGRPILSKYRERIMRREFENFSLRRTYLIADAVGEQV